VKQTHLLLLLFTQIIFAQNNLKDLSFQYLTINEGLSQNTVLAIAQDSTGYVWFGTKDGLNRYDGYLFKQFYSDFKDSNSLSSNEITALDVTPDGILWIGTNGGLNSYNPNNGKITQYYHEENDINSLSDDFINVIKHNLKGDLFIGTDKGFSIISADKKIKSYNILGDGKDALISAIVMDFKGNLWIGGTNSLSKFDIKSEKFTHINLHPESISKKEKVVVQSLLFKNDKVLWVGTRFGLIEYDIVDNKVVENLQNKIEFNANIREYLRNLFKDKEGNIWFAEWSGLRIYDNKNDEFISYNSIEKDLLNNSSINAILEDKSGVIWIGTSFGGVNYFDPTKQKFKTINIKSGLSNNIVSSISEDNKGNLYIGTIGGGLNKINKANNKIEAIAEISNKLIRVTHINGDDLWIGDWGNNLIHYSLSTKKTHSINLANLGFNLSANNAIKDIEFDKDKNLWVATSLNGIFKFNQNGDAENYPLNSISQNKPRRMREIFFDRNNVLWAITDKGLSKYDKELNSFNYIDFNDDSCIKKTKMISVYVDENNIFWIGTYGNGLLKIDIENSTCKNYKANENVPNNVIYAVLPDSTGNLWLSTNNGIAEFDTATARSNHFNIGDGLQSNEFNDNAFYETSDGALIFGGISGLNIIRPNEININKYIPPIVITNIKFLNSSLANKNYLDAIENNTITLNYYQTDFNIEFSALNYSQPRKNKYAYKLEPINNDWIYLANGRSLTFTNLKHGKYNLKIKGSNNDGVWNEKGTELSIIVLPPFWVTWWFVTIVFLIVVGIIFFGIYLKAQSIIKVERLRTKIASDLHDDVGSSLTKISMNASMLNYDVEPEKIKNRIANLSALSQEAISMMSDIVWSIDARNDSLQDLIDRMKNFAFNHVAEKEIDINFDANCNVNSKKLKINIRQNLYLIFKEALNNAVKYSESKRIDVSILANNEGLTLLLIDNGIGLKKHDVNKGNGFRNMKMRAERIKAQLNFIDENGLSVSLVIKKL